MFDAVTTIYKHVLSMSLKNQYKYKTLFSNTAPVSSMISVRSTPVREPIQIVREETRCRHNMGYSFQLAARVLLYAPSQRQDITYHRLCYTSRGALARTRYSSMGPPWGIDLISHCTMSRLPTMKYLSVYH